ncbi:phage tail tape measure protein [Abyssibius alkaniclasticus]|uniref:phage tail tape measure C-terminal domain-containing protein n=1 Tax=Abyssibius alkaniclasticus TaxID=2881234 RepID=UPI0023649B92|nr:phage tail tape measure C-terminal domain-containing protein [Abyssibius alkaniclasticus]UPH70221.1 phage tail tape measure protein [Abyssibius alkaniclasticus]
MAEKRVSVRLAAVGGRQVRAELEGVGEAGARGFGRLSREMEAANARLAAFSRRVRIAAAAAVAAAAAAGVAMVRSGLQTVDAQAKLAQSLGTTVASIQTLERAGELAGVSMSGIEQATKDLTRRLSQAAAGTGPAADALDRLGLSATDLIALPLDQRVGAINAAIESFVPAAERAAVAGQLFGEEGSIAMSRIDTATLRQATEDVLAFGVVVSEQDADQIERTNDAISRLGLVWRGLSNQLAVAAAPALEAVANAMAAVASRTGPLGIAIRGLFDNIGRLTTYAATFVAFLAGRWVAGMAAAALSVRGLATALVLLRGALIRTGIGALIVGAGELVYQFTRLVSGAGGFGEAMSLLKDLAVEVWDRIKMGAAAAGAAATVMFFDLKADAASGMQSAIESVVAFGNTAANTFEGAYEANKAIWGMLPAAIGDLVFQAANSLIDGVEAMLNGVVSRINTFIGGINQGLEALGSERRISIIPDLELGQIENRFEGAATAATTAAQTAFDRAFEDNPLAAPELGLTQAANTALATANTYRGAARDLAEGARAPLASWQALRDAVRGSDEGGADALTEATNAADRFETALGDAGRAAAGAGAAAGAAAAAAEPNTEAAVTGWQAVTAALSDYASKAREIGGDIGQALVGAFQSAENAVGDFVKTGKLDFRGLVTSLLADLAKLAARRFILGPIANALSGALGGAGGIFANILHAGGMVGASAPGRMVPAMAFAAAPRMHSGGVAGLRHDEVPAILQRGERVLSRREAQSYGGGGGVNVTIMARDAESFRQSRTQVAADIARAVSLGRRGM